MRASLVISSTERYGALEEVFNRDVRVSTLFARAESMLQVNKPDATITLASTTVNRRDERTITVLYELEDGRRFDDTYRLTRVPLADLLEEFIRSCGS